MRKIRASMLSSYNDCPRRSAAKQFRFEIENAGFSLREPKQSSASLVGVGTHRQIERYFRSRIDGTEFSVDLDKLSDLFAMDDIEWDKKIPSTEIALTFIDRMSTSYIENIGKTIIPVATEVSVNAEIDGFEVSGHIDLLCILNDKYNIRDIKTGSSMRSSHAQMGAYSLLYRSENPTKNISQLSIDFIKRNTTKKEQIEPVTIDYNIVACEQLAYSTIKRIINDYEKFKIKHDREAFPANPMSQMCSAKYCICYGTSFCPITNGGNK